MPDATVLYSVTALVVAALVVWVARVLVTAKEPWARPLPPEADGTAHDAAPEVEVAHVDAPALDADATARATPVALAGDGKVRTVAASDPKTGT